MGVKCLLNRRKSNSQRNGMTFHMWEYGGLCFYMYWLNISFFFSMVLLSFEFPIEPIHKSHSFVNRTEYFRFTKELAHKNN